MTIRRTTLVLLLGAVALVGAACGDDGEDSASSSSSTTTTTTSTTVAPTSSEPGATQPVVWPPEDGSVVYADPVEAATGFATDLVGFTDPVVGEFQQGDSRSGEVEVRAQEGAPVTTVLVRQVGDSWAVIGAMTANISLGTPEAGATVASPVALSGTATAFEGTVQVSVHARRSGDPLGTGFVTGGSMGEMGPFEGEVAYDPSDTADGSVVLYTISMEDGRVWEATAVPVVFPAG